MKITLTKIGKRFNYEWIFRGINYSFEPAGKYAITGANGSGKSTLLQIIAGALQFNEGTIEYEIENKKIAPEKIFQYLSLSAPFLELVEEMTLKEFLKFHGHTKGWMPALHDSLILDEIQLGRSATKQIRYFSSGMKQRVKLAQALLSDTPLVLLDEPLTNLDKAGIETYYHLVQKYGKDRLIIVGSNDPDEYTFASEVLELGERNQWFGDL